MITNLYKYKHYFNKCQLIIYFFKNKNKRSTEDYEAVYIANNHDEIREIKLFSFIRRKILTVCTSSAEMDKQICQYNDFGKAYNMPRVTRSDKYDNSFEISMVTATSFQDETLALSNIAQSTMAYNPSLEMLKIESAEKVMSLSYENEEVNVYMKKIADKISCVVSKMQVPHCMQHGDLSKNNLLYGECDGRIGFWWIDWEHAEERPFFYDCFFYIVHSAFYGNRDAFKCYIKGGADAIFEEFFEHFGLKYEKQYRFEYLMLYFMYFLNERVCFVSGLPTIKKYYELIESMEVELKNEA